MTAEKKTLVGKVVETLPNNLYRVELGHGRMVSAHVASQTRLYSVRLLPGDEVTLELSEYDGSRGHIVGREES